MTYRSLYAVAAAVASLAFAVMLSPVPAMAQALAVVTFAFALVVVVAVLTYSPPYAVAGWESDANLQSPTLCVDAVPAGFQVEQAPPVCLASCGGSTACECLVEAPAKRVRKPRAATTSRVAAKATAPAKASPRKPRVRKSAPAE